MIYRSDYEFFIGIDTGVSTGFAIYSREQKKLLEVKTVMIHEAMLQLLDCQAAKLKFFVRFEDARLRKWFGDNADDKKFGAGSIKRDAKIWEDFLKDKNIPFEAVHPVKGMTKLGDKVFKAMTGWQGVTSNHSRDAAMLVWGF